MKEMTAALQMVRRGQHPAEVARKLRVSAQSVRNWCRRAKVPYKTLPAGPQPDFEQQARAVELVKQGMKYMEVARELVISPASVCRYARAAGVSSCHPRSKPSASSH